MNVTGSSNSMLIDVPTTKKHTFHFWAQFNTTLLNAIILL